MVLLLPLLSDREPAVVFEHEQRADDVLQVVVSRERAHLRGHAAPPPLAKNGLDAVD